MKKKDTINEKKDTINEKKDKIHLIFYLQFVYSPSPPPPSSSPSS